MPPPQKTETSPAIYALHYTDFLFQKIATKFVTSKAVVYRGMLEIVA